MFHRHVWKIVEQREQPSRIEELGKAGVRNIKGGGWEDSWTQLATKDVIVKRVCETCGSEEVKRI